MKAIGALLILLGAAGVLFFFALFDTSVYVAETGSRVNNLGLMNTRLVGVVISLFLALVGVMLVIAGYVISQRAAPTTALKMGTGGFSPATQFQGSEESMSDRLDQIEQRKRASKKSGAGASILEQLKQNVK